MNIIPFTNLFHRFQKPNSLPPHQQVTLYPPGLERLSSLSRPQLPPFVQRCPVAMKYLTLLSPLDWEHLPWRPTPGPHPGPYPASPMPYIAAYLVKLDQQQPSMGHLRQFLVDHPSLTWVLGFPLQQDANARYGFDVNLSLPMAAHFSYVLRTLPNSLLQFLLADTVKQIPLALPDSSKFAQVVSLDTKHVIAWVKENNPKAYIKEGRCDKNRQPAGDPDCKYGCKRRRNLSPEATPTKDGQPATGLGVGKDEYYWGYASGVVATKMLGWGEFVLAEMTQTFDRSDVRHFFPLMSMVEKRLGFRPPYGTADAAYDAWYVYDYFHTAGGFAAVPYVDRTKGQVYSFTNDGGLPLCAAGLAMPVKGTFTNYSSTVVHERARHACPLLFPEKTGEVCPIDHKNWSEGGCISTLPTSIGTRIRYQLDRESEAYKAVYKQRTVVERIFSQAVALGIERPKLRNQNSITNLNTLIYTLINLRALHRIADKTTNNR